MGKFSLPDDALWGSSRCRMMFLWGGERGALFSGDAGFDDDGRGFCLYGVKAEFLNFPAGWRDG